MRPWVYLKKYLALYRPLGILRKKNRQVSIGHVWASVKKDPDTPKNFLLFFSLEFN
jgi:hypothetical protein